MNLSNLQVEITRLVLSGDKDHLGRIIQPFSKVLLIGNGGSNAVATHIATDYIKFLGKEALACTDPTFITATANDEGVENIFAKFVAVNADKNTLVILISSSGNSENIIRAAKYCVQMYIPFVGLSGFKEENRLNAMRNESVFSYWVDSESYGVVENMHQILLHSVVRN